MRINRKKMVLGLEEIKTRLPHRYPFLMIDRIIEQLPGSCVSIKNVTANEPYFLGHFPGLAVMPGVLIAEAMAQTAAFVGLPVSREEGTGNTQGKFLASMNVKIRRPVIPGDQLVIRVKVVKTMSRLTQFQGDVTVEGQEVASGEFNIADVNVEES